MAPQMMPPGNAMMPQQPGPMMGPQRGPMPINHDLMASEHAKARAQLDKLEQIAARQSAVKEQLEFLGSLGDLVSEEDVVSAAGRIVSAGVPSMSIATMLADAPMQQGGEALAQWVAGQAQQFAAKEQQMNQVLGVVRHQTGLAALRMLAAMSFGDLAQGAPGAAPIDNPLAPQGPGLMGPEAGVDASAPPLAPQGPLGGNALMMGDDDGA